MEQTRRSSLWMGLILIAVLGVLPGVALAGGETPSQWQGMIVETGENFIGYLVQLVMNLIA